MAEILGEERSVDRSFDIVALSKSLRAASGDSFANLFRDDHELAYREILSDVAKNLASSLDWNVALPLNVPEERLEDYIAKTVPIVDHPERSNLSDTDLRDAKKRSDAALRGERDEFFSASTERAFGLNAAFVSALLTEDLAVRAVRMISGPAMRKVVPSVLVLIHARRRCEMEELMSSKEPVAS